MSRKDKVGASNALKWLRGATQHQQVKDELNAVSVCYTTASTQCRLLVLTTYFLIAASQY